MNKRDYHVDNKTFLIYKEWEPLVNLLHSDADAGKLFRALFAYAMRGEVPEFTDSLQMAFFIMSRQFDRDGLKWEDKCERNAANGAKGGRPRKDKTAADENQAEKSVGYSEEPQKADEDEVKEEVKEEVKAKDEAEETDGECEKEPDEQPISVKSSYGEYNNVMLTDEEYASLKQDHPFFCEKYIAKLSEYLRCSGKSYADHAAVIRKWIREDNDIYKADYRPDSQLTPIELYERMADTLDPSMLSSSV